MNRSITQFMMWSHCFFLYEIYRGIYIGELFFTFLGSLTTLLSFFYHLSHEKTCCEVEPIVAKASMGYIGLSSIVLFKPYEAFNVLQCELVCFLVFFYANKYDSKHYNTFHPYLHLMISLTSHYYLNIYDRLEWCICENSIRSEINDNMWKTSFLLEMMWKGMHRSILTSVC